MMCSNLLRLCYYYLLTAATVCCVGSGASESRATGASSTQPMTCYHCMYYANIRVSISNKACITGESIETMQCPLGSACKLSFLQDSIGAVVHTARSCQRSGLSFKSDSDNVSVVLNARTTMYCRHDGCNNNWIGRPSDDAKKLLLHCWVGYGRHIDQFKLLPCSQKILSLTRLGNSNSSSGQSPVCMLAQLTRQIEYNGRRFESAVYMADCAPHATSVYGQNYPMFEYERVCQSPSCNSGGALDRIDVGLQMLAASYAPARAASSTFITALAAAATAALAMLL